MEPEQSGQLEYILGCMSVGVAILDCADLRFRYANAHLLSLLEESWHPQGVLGHCLNEIVPDEVYKVALPILQYVCSTGQSTGFSDAPFEGFLKTRGRTYWRINVQPAPGSIASPSGFVQQPDDGTGTHNACDALLVTVEDQTNLVHSRLRLEAVHNVSSAIAGPFALPRVLHRILQAVQEMVGSTRCAVMLIDQPGASSELRVPGFEEQTYAETRNAADTVPTIRVAAQRGLYPRSQDWHPQLSERLLVGRVLRDRQTLIITDTSTEPELEFPLLDDEGVPRRPGSVLCVPIFEPTSDDNQAGGFTSNGPPSGPAMGAVQGTIEVYHRRARGFPAEEVELLEQFAQQAGLAIQNARLFRSINRLATEQAAARERIEAEVIARTAELAQRNQALQIAKAAQEMESARLQLLLERLPSGVMLVSAADRRITIINNLGALLLQRMGWMPEAMQATTTTTPSGVILSPSGAINGAPTDPDVIAKLAVSMNIEELLRATTMYGPSGSIIAYEQQPLSLALSNGEAREAELHFTQSDGQTLFLLVNAAPLRTSDGTISSAVTVWHDITQLKALERVREDFFTTMAHELKTPLANIRAHVSALLARDLEWSVQEQHDFLEAADEQVERLVDMINYFLDASRVEAGALRLELEPILLAEMLEDLQDRLEALIASSQRHLEIHAPADLPAVVADYELIMNVLTNLLSNAFHYAPEGDTVLLEAEPVFGTSDQQLVGVELRVIDHGSGMTQEQQTQLFTRFSTFAAMSRPAADRPGQFAPERRRGSARWSPATGLGLYISRGIIEAHGSTLTLKSSPGQGTTFAFILPAASAIKREVG